MTNGELIYKLLRALKLPTIYVNGGWGWPMTNSNKSRAMTNSYNASYLRALALQAATPQTFGFDCVCLIKSILWGWTGDASKRNGGAVYASNGVPDINADQMIRACGPRTDFDQIVPGAAVWIPGHIGVYVGDGCVIECTPIWSDGVQLTGLNGPSDRCENWRSWSSWGLLPWVDYVEKVSPMVYDEFKQCMEKYLEELQAAPAARYATTALAWINNNGIMRGDGNGNLMPRGYLTRQDFALMLMRYNSKQKQ